MTDEHVNNQIMFVGKDVATALGYAKPENIATHVDADDKTTTPDSGDWLTYLSFFPCNNYEFTGKCVTLQPILNYYSLR